MLSRVIYQADGTVDTFAVPFPFISRAHVQFSVDGESVSPEWVTDGLVNLGMVAGTVRIERVTPVFERDVDFVDTSMLTAKELDDANIQLFYKCQELLDDIDEIEPDPVVPPLSVSNQTVINSVPNEVPEFGPDFQLLSVPIPAYFWTVGRQLEVTVEGVLSADPAAVDYFQAQLRVLFQDQTYSGLTVQFTGGAQMEGPFVARFVLNCLDYQPFTEVGVVGSAEFRNASKTQLFNSVPDVVPKVPEQALPSELKVMCSLANPGDTAKFSRVSVRQVA